MKRLSPPACQDCGKEMLVLEEDEETRKVECSCGRKETRIK